MPIDCQREKFDLPRDVAYLNCAYMSPLPRETVLAGQQALARKSQPWTIRPADFFSGTEEARDLFARIIGATADDIALAPSASYGMAVACANLPLAPGQQVVMLNEEFPSTIYPWRERARAAGAEVILVPRPANDDWTSAVLDHITDRTAVAALPVCHWTDGALLELATISARLRQVGATLAIDATQSMGAFPFELARIQPDFVAVAAYKWLLGPYSTGFLYVAPQWQNGTPIEHNWITREGSEDFARLVNYRDTYQPGARRFDVGEPSNFGLLPALCASLRQLLEWQIERIAETLRLSTSDLARRAERFGFTAVVPERRAPHYLGLRMAGGLPAGLGERLAAHQVFVSTRGAALRITPHLYNDAVDLERFEHAMEAVISR